MFDGNDPTDIAELKTEIDTDPVGIGYFGFASGNATGDTKLINAKNPAFRVGKPKIDPAVLRSAVTYDAYNNLSIDEQEYLRWITGSTNSETETLSVTDDLRTILLGTTTVGQTNAVGSWWAAADRDVMVAAMSAIIDVEASRAEVLWGYQSSITITHWAAARDS